jgi:hypothetical protein
MLMQILGLSSTYLKFGVICDIFITGFPRRGFFADHLNQNSTKG